MSITTTQRHTPAESVNERTSGRRIDAQQQFVSFRITETGNTDAAGKFTLTHTPIGSLTRQFDNPSRINKDPDLVALTALDAPLYSGEFDQNNRTIELYTDAAKTTPAANLVGAKVSYWYYAPIKGTLNADGTFTPDTADPPGLDMKISELQAAITGADVAAKTLADVVTALANIKIDASSIDLNTDGLEGGLTSILDKIIAAPSTEAKQDALAALIGEVQAAPTVNTLLARMKSLEDKIDAITAGTTPATVELNGSMLDLRGTAATKPLATAVTIGATYWSVDTDPNADAIEVSDGTNWVVL